MKLYTESIKGKPSFKKINFRSGITSILSVLFILCMLMLPVNLNAQDDFVDSAKEALSELAESGDLLESCIQYQGLSPEGGCTEADSSGKGLNCPKTDKADGGRTETCSASIMSELKGSLGVEAKAKLEGSKLSSAEMHATIEPVDSVSHDHQKCASPASECDERFIKRKDFVKFKLALYNGGKVSVGITDPDFNAQVSSSEGYTMEFEALICAWKDHEGDRKCSECVTPVCTGGEHCTECIEQGCTECGTPECEGCQYCSDPDATEPVDGEETPVGGQQTEGGM